VSGKCRAELDYKFSK